jgi:hypothetical protein
MCICAVTTSHNMANVMEQTQYAYGAKSVGGKLELLEFKPPALGEHEVFVDVKVRERARSAPTQPPSCRKRVHAELLPA